MPGCHDGAPNTRIWTASTLIGIEPTSAQNERLFAHLPPEYRPRFAIDAGPKFRTHESRRLPEGTPVIGRERDRPAARGASAR